MRMKRRRAAMKEYLSAATRIATETTNSCHTTCALAHVSRPANPTATTLSGSGLSRSSPHFRLKVGLFSSSSFPFPFSTPLRSSFSARAAILRNEFAVCGRIVIGRRDGFVGAGIGILGLGMRFSRNMMASLACLAPKF
ncbi:hypothetical protein V2J09_023495 [Rumex salicifolius]